MGKFPFVGVTHGQANYNLIHADVGGRQNQHWLYRRAGRRSGFSEASRRQGGSASIEYFTELYLGQPYERDAYDFAYEKVKELLGDSPELQELHMFWTPKKPITNQAYEELYRQIDEITGETSRETSR